MAVIQISKIQVRRGAIGEQGMPQLASGEMGWAVDTQQLFIGNGSVAEGAPAVGNTEILTQYSTATINLFNCIYEYQGGKPDGYFRPHTVERTLQSKLDERVSVLDFGADPTGTNPCDHAIQTAITATYMNSHNAGNSVLAYRKILHFPAGTYKITGTIYLPPYSTIQGEGADRTALVSISTGGNNTIFKTRSISQSLGGGVDFKKPLNALSDPVNNVAILDMSFEYDSTVPIYTNSTNTTALLNLDMATMSEVRNCKFQGTYTNSWGVSDAVVSYTYYGRTQSPTRYAGISITGVQTSNLEIDNNKFVGLVVGTFCYQDNKHVSYLNNTYDTLYLGMQVGAQSYLQSINETGNLYGHAINNKFLNINKTGITVNVPAGTTSTTGFVSNGNLFFNVGNGIVGNESGQLTECIAFNSSTGCVSVNDQFTRFNLSQTQYKNATLKPMVTGQAVQIDDKTAYRYPIVFSTITTSTTLIRIPYLNTLTTVTMDYQIHKSTGFRKGTFTVSAPPFGLGTPSYKDDYNYVGTDPAVVLTATLISSTGSVVSADCIAIRYENDAYVGATGNGTISLTVKYQT